MNSADPWAKIAALSSLTQGVCVIVSLFLIFWQVYKDHDQRKKAATMTHIASMTYDRARDIKLCGTDSNGELIPMTYDRAKFVNMNPDLHSLAFKLLAEMEFYSTGVNTSVFDLDVANRLNGGFVIAQYVRYHAYIQLSVDLQRDISYKQRLYDQFEALAFQLNSLRPPARELPHVNREPSTPGSSSGIQPISTHPPQRTNTGVTPPTNAPPLSPALPSSNH